MSHSTPFSPKANGIIGMSMRRCASHIVLLCVLAGSALLAYSNMFQAEFVYDDYPFIVDNPAVRSLSDPARFFLDRDSFSEGGKYVIYRPLAALSFALNYRLSGYDPAFFHLVNIALHILCGVALYFFLFDTFSHALMAFFAAVLFLLHPVQTEAVSWISARGNPMFLLFLLLSMMCYRRSTAGATTGRIAYAAALGFAALSLLSKEMAVVLPFLLFVYDVSVNRPSHGSVWKQRLPGIIPFLALSLGYIALRHWVLGETRQIEYWGGSMYTALLTMTKAFLYYVRLTLFPMPLMVEYVVPVARSALQPTVIVSSLGLLFIGITCFFSYRGAPTVFFGILWFFVSLLPVSNIIPLKAILNERFLYLPSIGFCLLLASTVRVPSAVTARRMTYAVYVALLMISACYGILTFDRNRDWRDSLSLWTASVRKSPAGPTSQYNLGLALYQSGRYAEAIEHLKLATLLQSEFPSARGALGNVYFTLGDFDAAIKEYEIGLAQAPDDDRLRNNLAFAWFEKAKKHADMQQKKRAEESLLNALRYKSDFAPARRALERLQESRD